MKFIPLTRGYFAIVDDLKRFRVDGTGSWFVGVFEAAEDGDDKELVWEKAA